MLGARGGRKERNEQVEEIIFDCGLLIICFYIQIVPHSSLQFCPLLFSSYLPLFRSYFTSNAVLCFMIMSSFIVISRLIPFPPFSVVFFSDWDESATKCLQI